MVSAKFIGGRARKKLSEISSQGKFRVLKTH
jgi:hypothetical protein